MHMHTSGAMYGGVPHFLLSFLSLPMCLYTVDRPKSDIFTVSVGNVQVKQPTVHVHELADVKNNCMFTTYRSHPIKYSQA